MYKVPVKIEAIEKRKRVTAPLHAIAGLYLLANAASLSYDSPYSFPSLIPIYAVAAISILYGVFRKKADPSGTYNHWIRVIQFFTFAMLAIYTVHVYNNVKVASLIIWGIVILFLMFTERKVFHDTDITIKADGIYMPGYFTGHLVPWHNISDLILRNDYITVAKSNNKLVQLEVVKVFTEEEIDEINQYSRHQLTLGIQNPSYT